MDDEQDQGPSAEAGHLVMAAVRADVRAARRNVVRAWFRWGQDAHAAEPEDDAVAADRAGRVVRRSRTT